MIDPIVIEDCFKLFTKTCNDHKGRMYTTRLDWEIVKCIHPRTGEKYDQLVPLIDVEWK